MTDIAAAQKCRFCDGRGFYGSPGQRCGMCDGSGTTATRPLRLGGLQPKDDPNGMWAAVAAMKRGMTDWRPIETAPKDGTAVVLAEWSDYSGQWQFGVSHWRKYRVEGEGFAWIGHNPTHWMPLPPAPAHPVRMHKEN